MLRPSGAVLSVVALVVLSSASEAADEIHRPRLTLALSGGGARGIAHVGVLKALEESGIHVDGVAGTSVGALVGSLFASGYKVENLEGIIDSLDWQALFTGRSDRRLLPVSRRRDDAHPIVSLAFDLWKVRLPAAALAEYPINRFLIRYLSGPSFAAEGDFDRLKIPFRAVATALDNGERMVLSRGSLPRAVRGSISFPVAFPPIDYQGRILVDGGLVDNLPTAAARALGGDVVVAVDIQSLPLEPSRWEDLVGVAGQVSNILGGISNNVYHEEPDVLIKPDLGRHSFNDYSGFHELIAKGYDATIAALPEIRRCIEAASAAQPAAPSEVPKVPDLKGRLIREIKVAGNDKYPERLIRRSFNVPLGVPFDLDKALLALDKVHATGFFDHCWLDAEPMGDDGLRLILRVKESPPNLLEVGASFSDANKAKATFRLRNRNLFGFGEELDLGFAASDGGVGARVVLQGDQIFTNLLGYDASLYSYSERPRFFVDGEYVNRARFQRDGARLVLRHGVKRLALFDGGFVFGRVKTEPRLGLDFAQANDSVRLLTGGINYDVLDDFIYPERGQRLQLRGDKSSSSLGASRDYWRASLSARLARRLGKRGVVELDAFGGLSGGDLPVYEEFRLGGPVLLPGWHDGELWGGQAVAGSISYRHRLVGQLRLVARGGSGNVWDQRREIRLDSFKVGAGLGLVQPTRIGPVALELGIRERGKALVTLSVGNP